MAIGDVPDLETSPYATNPSGGAISQTHNGVGQYAVTFHDINPSREVGGHVTVTPYGATDAMCSINSWISVDDDVTAFVDCFDSRLGEPADTRFAISLIPPTTYTRGDFNVDGMINADDVDDLCIRIGSSNASYDLDDDGDVDSSDMHTMIHDILGTHYGDANLDGVFDSGDLIQLFASAKYETGRTATWADGDFNCDGVFNSSDLIVALADGGYSF
jgi:hypothetical protein